MFNKKQKRLQKDYARVFGTKEGKRVLQDLMENFHATGSVFSPDALAMAHSEGERNVILYIMTRLRMNEPDYLRAMKQMPMSVNTEDEMEDYDG